MITELTLFSVKHEFRKTFLVTRKLRFWVTDIRDFITLHYVIFRRYIHSNSCWIALSKGDRSNEVDPM